MDRIENAKFQILISDIKESSSNNPNNIQGKLNLLTGRQREIFNLIYEGKSNKEIIDELYIELSTLKTHINRIYKTLDITSRKEVRAINEIK